MEINEYQIKLSGTANIENSLNLERNADLTIKDAEITSSKDIPTGDGTINRIFTIKITTRSLINILTENKILSAKKKGSQSQKLRNVIRQNWEQQASAEIEFDEFYKQRMSEIIEIEKEKLI